MKMAHRAAEALKCAMSSYKKYSAELAARVRKNEEICDRYEDMLGTYLVHLSACKLTPEESVEAAQLLKAMGDFERISTTP